jgi:hypothetical protein
VCSLLLLASQVCSITALLAAAAQEELLQRCQQLASQPPVDVFEQEQLHEFQAIFAEGAFVDDEAMFVGPRPKRSVRRQALSSFCAAGRQAGRRALSPASVHPPPICCPSAVLATTPCRATP